MTSTGTITLDRLRRDGERFLEELSREHYLAGAGLKTTAELQPIYEKHRATIGRDALGLVLDAFRSAPEGSEDKRSARLLLDWQTESQSARELAPLEEREIEWEGSAKIRLDDGRIVPYQRAAIEIANATDRRERLAIESARATLIESELAPIKRERFQRERDIVEALDLANGYNATFELLSGVSLTGLRDECERFLRDTQPMWDDVFPEFVKRVLRIDPKDARRSDALALLRAREYDDGFPAAMIESSIARQVREMGVDVTAGGRVVLDIAEREGKRSRAFCAPVRIPNEVYLVLRPHGGQADWSTFLHELGHTLHFAYMRPDLPFEYRWLGDNSITEGFAMLFDHRMQDAGWLKRYTALPAPRVREFLRSSGFEELHYLRRYAAKLIYEMELYGGSTSWGSLPDLYVSLLTNATNFQYDPSGAFTDVDARFYATRYLRAWQLQALINETLVERYDDDWWRNPRAGPWIVQSLFGEGQRELAQEQAARIASKELSFAPLVRAIEKMLG